MSIQFLDMRLSENRSDNLGTQEITMDVPLFIGDLGIQTLQVVGTPNQSNVRVWLSGTVTVRRPSSFEGEPPTMTLWITRDGTGIPSTGTIIYTMNVTFGTNQLTILPISITACDFPSASVVAPGQIRYSLFITSTARLGDNALILDGPVAFNGMASAGSN
ncbi:hypothetical protein [Cohnella soli]|uniref:Uncharacterized protein n=1 Tax=Cohnella soli TaxID=425005 RepID=A0ABW0HSE3_9BACL